jgi:hypothetical protein
MTLANALRVREKLSAKLLLLRYTQAHADEMLYSFVNSLVRACVVVHVHVFLDLLRQVPPCTFVAWRNQHMQISNKNNKQNDKKTHKSS